MRSWWRAVVVVMLAVLWPASSAPAQQSNAGQQPAAEKPASAPDLPQDAQTQRAPGTPKRPVIETAAMRLASARNVLIIRTRGSMVPLEVIQSTLDGWGRFTLVETKDKADLVIEIASNGDSSIQVSCSSSVSPETGREEKSTSSRKDLSPTEITMTVIDARNKRPLWSATESVKFAVKEKTKENNLVEAAERLAAKFHQRLEPAAK